MKSLYNVYDVRENRNTKNFFGYEIIVDGERGLDSFPGRWDLSDARRHYACGLPWSVPRPDMHTFIIRLSDRFYAFAADCLMTTVYAIGPDRSDKKGNVVYFTGCVQERNAAILSVAVPHTWTDAYKIARSYGIYSGQ